MNTFVGLAHTVFNAGLNALWIDNANERRFSFGCNATMDELNTFKAVCHKKRGRDAR
jgi:hypothetical protein